MKKIALITGASKRIGKEIALHLAHNGWKIAIHCNKSTKDAKKLSEKISQITESIVVQKDLKDIKTLNSLLNDIKNQIGTPTLLINNAAAFSRDNDLIDADSLTEHMNVNCFAPILLTQTFAEMDQKDKIIINIIDFFANTPTKSYISYNLSKTAMLYATKCLALKFPNCRINAISPGMTIEPEEGQEQEVFRKLVKTVHKHKKTGVSDILKAIDFLINKDEVTGQNIILTDAKKDSFTLTF